MYSRFTLLRPLTLTRSHLVPKQCLGKGTETVLSKTVLSARFESTVFEKTVFRTLGPGGGTGEAPSLYNVTKQ